MGEADSERGAERAPGAVVVGGLARPGGGAARDLAGIGEPVGARRRGSPGARPPVTTTARPRSASAAAGREDPSRPSERAGLGAVRGDHVRPRQQRLAVGRRRRAASPRTAPLVATSTGSTTSGRWPQSRRRPARRPRASRACRSSPTATGRSSSTASSWAATAASGDRVDRVDTGGVLGRDRGDHAGAVARRARRTWPGRRRGRRRHRSRCRDGEHDRRASASPRLPRAARPRQLPGRRRASPHPSPQRRGRRRPGQRRRLPTSMPPSASTGIGMAGEGARGARRVRSPACSRWRRTARGSRTRRPRPPRRPPPRRVARPPARPALPGRWLVGGQVYAGGGRVGEP